MVCLPCKEIINNGLMAPAAAELTEIVGKNHMLYKPARHLAAAARASYVSYKVLVEQGAIAALPVDDVGWAGCDEATEIMSWVTSLGFGHPVPSNAAAKMTQWAEAANVLTSKLVSGQWGV